jgi:hypothetical protein
MWRAHSYNPLWVTHIHIHCHPQHTLPPFHRRQLMTHSPILIVLVTF